MGVCLISKEKIMNILKQGLLVLITIGFHAHGATDEFSKAERGAIQRVIGYAFKDLRLLRSAFTHSSRGNAQFEAFETEGDKLIRGLVTDICRRPGMTSAVMHEEIESRNTNSYFAARYETLGLDKFLEKDPTVSPGTVYANAMEALVGAIAEDYYNAYPHLQGTGRVFKVLSSVVKRLIVDENPVLAISSIPSILPSSTKNKFKFTIQKGEQKYAQQAKGATVEEAEENALRALWSKLRMSEKPKKNKNLKALCQTNGWTITTH